MQSIFARTTAPSRRWLPAAGAVMAMIVLAASCVGSDEAIEDVVEDAVDDPSDDEVVLAAAESFLAEDGTVDAAALVELMAADGDRRWAPWLLDLLRLGGNSLTDVRIGEVLEGLSGIPSRAKVVDSTNHGSWAQSLGLDGGPGYRAFKSTTYGRIDARFVELLDSIESQRDLAAIQWGGVPLGGIPELNQPARLTADEATWMIADDPVLGIEIDGEAMAYPLRILAHHELVNDTVGGSDIAVVYCTLCRSALVFDSVVDGTSLRFQTSGLLLNSNKIMYDEATGSLWHHLLGLGIGGPMTGVELVTLPVELLEWSDWVERHPDTEVLDLPKPIFFEDPERPPIAYDYRPGAAYRSYYESADLWFPTLDTPDDFAPKTEVVGLEHDGVSVAIELAAITETIEVDVGGARFTVEPTGPGVRVTDAAGDLVVVEQSFWFAWFANHPDTEVRIPE